MPDQSRIGGRRGDQRDAPAAVFDLGADPFGPAAGLSGAAAAEV